MYKYYYDMEHDEIITIQELEKIYNEEVDTKQEKDFPYYVSCCMAYNNGSLLTLRQRIYELEKEMESYIFMESDKTEYQWIIDEIAKLEKLEKENGLQ